MSDPSFIHLRVHSEYSITDSIVRLPALVAAAAADRQPAVALTDLANLFGWIKFYKAARASGIKPILGVDCWITNTEHRDRPSRMLLLARNYAGYLRLCELISRAWLENEYQGRGEIDPSWFDEGSPQANEGLVALSGAAVGEIGRALLDGRKEAAHEAARRWAGRFPGAFYLEVQRAGQPDDEMQTRLAATLAAQLELPVVATHPVQFLEPGEYEAHRARVCIAEGGVLGDTRRTRRFTGEQYFTSQDEMAERFADLPSALANSVEIARRCSLTMTLDQPRLPDFPTPEGVSLDDYMRQLAADGLVTRMQALFPEAAEREAHRAGYEERLAYECDMIVRMGFSGYFLIVADFINWAKNNGVPVGPGRGSGAGSLVAFALGITDLDPIPYALLFERFLNPERVSMPDFDIDFCQDNRYKVIEYVRETYGADAVSQIATFGTMASRAVIRDVGRVLELPYPFCDQLSKLVPVVQNKPLSLARAREAEPLLAERERNEEEVRELLALAEPLEDLARNVGMHAGGVLIAPGRLIDFTPLYKAPGDAGGVVSQYDKKDVESVGLVKFDFLGLRNLTIIQLAVDYINHRHPGLELDLAKLEFTDPRAYQILKDANTVAIFQVEGEGMRKLLVKLAPDRFEDIIAVLALYRPGPLGSGMIDDFILRKRGQQEIDYFHPDLKQTLEPTYGVIVYQEQVMQIAQIIGGYTLGSADLLRRAMGKKDAREMAEHRDIFIAGAKERGYDADLATRLFDLMAMFAEYGFNKSHTAAYAVITYQTAWLKAHYPAEFMAATLSSDMDDTDKIDLLVADAQSRINGLRVMPPDINLCGLRFEPIADDTIRYGLGAIKGTGEAAVAEILRAREAGPFTDLFEFCARIDRRAVGKRTIEALVRAGAFDRLDPDRARLLANVGRAIELADLAEEQAGQASLFGDGPGVAQDVQWLDVPPWGERQRLLEEKSALGFFLTGHLFSACAAEVRHFAPTPLERLVPTQQPVWLAGIVAAQNNRMTRRGKMAFVTLDDGSAKVEVSVFNELYDSSRHLVRGDELLVVQAKVTHDDYSGGLRIVAERLLDLAGARVEFARALRLSMSKDACAERLHKLMAEVRATTSGTGCPVEIRYRNHAASCLVRLPDDWRVMPAEPVLDELRQWLDADSVELHYA